MEKESLGLIKAVCGSIQDAYSIKKILEHLACIGDNCTQEAKEMYWAILYDCAKCICQRLAEYSCGYVPVDPFDLDEPEQTT